MAASRKKKDARIRKRNKRRLANGKDTLDYKLTLAERFREIVGEPPVILDTTLARESEDQLSLYLMKKGYFNNEVSFNYKTFDHWPRRKKAKLYYELKVDKPYTIDSIFTEIKDNNIEQIFRSKLSERLVKSRDQFDVEVMDEERSRITRDLRNNGYYYFVKEFIEFEADSVNKDHQVNLKMTIRNPKDTGEALDSANTAKHISYNIGEVVVNYNIPKNGEANETTSIGGYTFVGTNKFPLNPVVIARNIFINKGAKYAKNEVDYTYQRLLAFELIGLVNILFEEDPYDQKVLNVRINITFNKRATLALETTGTTNSGDNLGVQVSTVLKHKNVFSGAEVLNLELQGGVESQNLIIQREELEGTLGSNPFNLNTIEFGPKLQLTVPRLIVPYPFKFLNTSKSTNQSTIFSSAYNFQARDDYKRSLIVGSLGYNLRETSKSRLSFNLLEINVIKINKEPEFQARLDTINDQFLNDTYSDHFILSSNASFVMKTKKIPDTRISLYNKSNIEGAGNMLRALGVNIGLPTNDEGSYLALDIPFAQYIKFSDDLRLYRKVNNKSALAMRIFGGLGVPLENLDVLPFSRSFYGGGANGNRAWKARSLGPGSYWEGLSNFDKIGDIQMEANLEYRFDLINYLEGALFMDAGNIWLFNSDSIRVGGQFNGKDFLSEIAIGLGIGARLNFDYFLVRFDLALQAKDPSLFLGERWVFDDKILTNQRIDDFNAKPENANNQLPYYRPRLNFNIGIGYPF